jgi:hypothetical protein
MAIWEQPAWGSVIALFGDTAVPTYNSGYETKSFTGAPVYPQ